MSMLLRLFELFMSFSMGKSSGLAEKSQALTENVVNRVRQMMIVMVTAIGALTLFCVGVSMTVTDLLKQIDANGGFTSTATFYGGLTLTILTLGTLIYCLREKTWLKATGVEKEAQMPRAEPVASPIEAALALLITDFVQERSLEREKKIHE